jgi:hypothetical protein
MKFTDTVRKTIISVVILKRSERNSNKNTSCGQRNRNICWLEIAELDNTAGASILFEGAQEFYVTRFF